ncbi:DUF3710 domain-containing protein [Catenuloplanes atrovinosus]|uniref:DUF3710 domain-containing protein n=1 Tax=Catenuloplanes atrovinosus TaxID=137266 RepID=A0AAE4C9E7_9ACTN|nr:DUF3710 domain-containing protein [Catenuloplanes atrovinosus]MDR7273510.1 hypothetical protein [Catenuloplanes atrovinosus]
MAIFNRGGRHARAEDTPIPTGSESGATTGPYDAADAPDDVQRLDLGSMKIPAVPGVEVRVQAGPEGVVQQVVLGEGPSTLQLIAVAAPRSEGIWDEVREEVGGSLAAQGGQLQEAEGPYGVELLARVPTPNGPVDLRIAGIDGPRWMVQAVFQGPVATTPASAPLLGECLRGLVVDRGQEAKPVKEPLPLRLPKEVAAQGPDGAATPPAPPAPPADEPRRRPSPRPRS